LSLGFCNNTDKGLTLFFVMAYMQVIIAVPTDYVEFPFKFNFIN